MTLRCGGGWLERLAIAAVTLLVAGGALAQPAAPASSAAAGGLHVHVRGSAELQAVASAEPDGFTIRGELIDDAGSPIPRAPITVQAFALDDPRTPLRLASLEPCEGASDGRGGRFERGRARGDGEITTDDRGAFCVIGKAPIAKLTLKVRFGGSKIHDPFDLDVPLEAAEDHLLRTVLRFEPPPEVVDLDHESATITASLRVDRSEASRAGPTARREGLALTLEDERGQKLAEALTGGDGRARFEAKSAAFDKPGPGELVARFAGRPGIAKASISQPVIRRAEVRLALAHPIESADADDGFTIDVDVTTSRGPVSGGVVEIVRAVAGAPGRAASGERVGAGEVDGGHARVVVSFAAGGASAATITLRYVPAAPWYRAGPALQTEVSLAGPGVLKQVVVALLVLAAAAWVVQGWRRAPKAIGAAGDVNIPGPPSGRAGVQILAPAPAGGGWRGTVSDAHEGAPVAGARLAIIAPAFEGDGVVAEAFTDARGAFVIEAAHRSDARLVVESPLHSSYEQPLPPPSVLGVALVTRRRAVLERLVRWARRQGSPFDGPPEPTPGHVRRVAARGNTPEIEAWARRVEVAAFGPAPVGEAAEQEVRASEPKPLR